MIRKRHIIGLAAAAVLSLTAVIGVAAQQGGNGAAPSNFVAKLAGKLGVSPDQLQSAIQQTESELIDEGVASGRITAERAAEMKQRIAEGKGMGFGHRGGPGHGRGGPKLGGMQDIAGIIGIDGATLRTEMESGKTLAQIAEAHGKSRADVKAALLKSGAERLDKLVAEGKITAEQKQSMLDQLSTRIDTMLDASGPLKQHKPGRPGASPTATP